MTADASLADALGALVAAEEELRRPDLGPDALREAVRRVDTALRAYEDTRHRHGQHIAPDSLTQNNQDVTLEEALADWQTASDLLSGVTLTEKERAFWHSRLDEARAAYKRAKDQAPRA